ncbi:DUF819 family protein [Rhodocaloribacter litoris]|uniref:DUF819 family protein n=1 Tax=Rhodocaloribacter litoris TaxID=2558931 RepID=UPI001423A990|nr:DUF819 family protein [Rhodocaloribacter litoris]QXD15578.1 DUF819 family protein [Rhodocaloribacter litoris]
METLFPITEPTHLFAFLAAVLGLVFWLSTLPPLKKLFEFLPPVIWAYFVPMIATTLGITPDSSPVYSWMSRYLLPFSLFLLMITVDLPAVLRLGKTALLMMLAGTLGIVVGGPVAYLIFKGFLPEDAWQGLAALSGSWIGGTANMVAIQQHIESTAVVPTTVDLGPIIVVDTVVGYGWMGVLIFLSAFQHRFNRRVQADTRFVDELNRKLLELDTARRPVQIADLAMIVGVGLAATVLARLLGEAIPPVRLDPGAPSLISGTTWAILIVVTAGLLLSFTPMRTLERPGASRLGYLALYLLLTSIGARADLKAVLDAPLFLLTGVVWISIHVALLFLAARLLRAPMFFVATGSMANVGGAASAPIVAEVYLPGMAPVGLLMAVAGYILGIYAALACAEILRFLSML